VEKPITGTPRARDLRRRRHRLREQRTEHQFGAFLQRLLRRLLRALRRAAVVLHQDLDIGIVEFEQRHLGCVLHRQRDAAGIALRRQRQDQRDLDGAAADQRAGWRRRHLLLRQRRIVDSFTGAVAADRAAAGERQPGQRGEDRAAAPQTRGIPVLTLR
jgi:hypothetical protein